MADEREPSAAGSDTPNDGSGSSGVSDGRDPGATASEPPVNGAPAPVDADTSESPRRERRSADSIVRRRTSSGSTDDEHVPSRPGDVRHTLADITKAEQLLGYRPTVGFADGMRRTCEYFVARFGAASEPGRRAAARP